MLKHRGGETVGKGTYWNFGNGERIDISNEGVLAGDGSMTYYKMSAAGLLLAGPILGLLYAAFLPFIGIAMVTKLVMQKAGAGIMETVREGASFGWRPSESYLSGKKAKGQAKEEKAPEKEDEKVE